MTFVGSRPVPDRAAERSRSRARAGFRRAVGTGVGTSQGGESALAARHGPVSRLGAVFQRRGAGLSHPARCAGPRPVPARRGARHPGRARRAAGIPWHRDPLRAGRAHEPPRAAASCPEPDEAGDAGLPGTRRDRAHQRGPELSGGRLRGASPARAGSHARAVSRHAGWFRLVSEVRLRPRVVRLGGPQERRAAGSAGALREPQRGRLRRRAAAGAGGERRARPHSRGAGTARPIARSSP